MHIEKNVCECIYGTLLHMAKGKHLVTDVASDQEAYLENEYDDLFAEIDNLADVENEAHFDGAEIDGVEFDGGDNDGVDLNKGDFDGVEMDGVNFVPPDVDVPESSNFKKGVNMGARQNKRVKTKKRKIVVQYNEMGVPAGDEATELASFIGILEHHQKALQIRFYYLFKEPH